MHGEQFLGAQHAERLSDLGTDLVLAAVAARGGDEDGAHALAEAEQREQPVVLVVWMRVGLHERAGARELAEQQFERRGVGALAHGRDAQLSRDADGEARGDRDRHRDDRGAMRV